ncbi:MAG: 50S ribosomal protein L25 [bacterium]
MMSPTQTTLKAETRDETDQSSNRQLRENKKIPAVIYGQGIENKNLSIKRGDIVPLLQSGALNNRLLELEIDDENDQRSVLIKDVDQDPVSDNLIHVDFHQVRSEDEVQIEVPIKLVGESPGVELDNGIIDQPMRTVSVDCKVKDIPGELEVDIGDLEVGDAVFVEDLSVPAGVTITDKPEQTIVSIQPPEEFDLEVTPAQETAEIEETVEEAMEEVAEAEEEELPEEEVEGEEGEAPEAPEETPEDGDFESDL